MFEARRGARKVASPSSNPTNAKQAVTPTASRRAAWSAPRQDPPTDAAAASLDIGQQRDEPHPHVAQRIHEGLVAWIDHHVGLRADAHPEARRVGKECVSTVRSRGSAYP